MNTASKARIIELKKLYENNPETLAHINEVIDLITDLCLVSVTDAFKKAKQKKAATSGVNHGH